MTSALKAAVEAPFRFLFRAIWEIQSYTFLSSRAIANLFSRPIYGRDIVQQMDRIGVASLTIILLTGFFTGAVLGIQSESALRRYGAVSITGQLVAMTLVRELGPVLVQVGNFEVGAEPDRSLPGRQVPEQELQQRGLATAGWPHNRCNSILGYRKADLFQDLVFPKKSAEFLDL
jgi:hypothetical protein